MSKLPEEFADLERFTDWCLPTEAERYAKRLTSTMAEMQAFYDAGMPGSRTSWSTVDRVPARRHARRRQGSDASDAVDGHGVVPGRGVEAAARARQRRRLHGAASRSRWSERC